MKELEKQLSQIANGLEENDMIHNIENLCDCIPMQNKHIDSLIAEYNIELPKKLRDFYHNVGSITLKWDTEIEIKGKKIAVAGRNDILRLNNHVLSQKIQVFNSDEEYELQYFWEGNYTEEQKEQLKKYYIFDKIDIGIYVLFDLEQTIDGNPNLYLLLPPFRLYSLHLTIEEYLHHLINNKGLYLWQWHVQQLSKEDNSKIHNEYFLETLEVLFPDADKSLYKIEDVVPELPLSDNIWTTKLQELQSRLNNDSRVEYAYFHIQPPIHDSLIQRIENVWAKKIPNDMLSFYKEMNGFKFGFKFKDGENVFIGNSHIRPLEYSFGGMKAKEKLIWDDTIGRGTLWVDYFEEEDPDWVEAVQGFRIIDSINPELFIVFPFEEIQKNIELKLLQFDNAIQFKLNFIEYIHMVIHCAGLEHWQYLFTEEEEWPSLESVLPVKEHFKILNNGKKLEYGRNK